MEPKTNGPVYQNETVAPNCRESLLCPHLRNQDGARNLELNEKVKAMLRAGERVYHFGFGQSPFPAVESAVEGLKEHAAENGYVSTEGILPLRRAICKFHKKYDHLNFTPDQVVVAPGTKQSIYLIIQVFNGDILLLSPTWATYRPQAQILKKRSFLIDTKDNEWKVSPELIDRAIHENDLMPNRLLILCSPDNPTGISYTDAELTALTVAFRRHNITVISDEIYARQHYTQDHVSLAKHYPDRTILSSGMSKWPGAGGWRVGYAVFPEELDILQEGVKNIGSHLYACCPSPIQLAITQMLADEKGIESYIQHTVRILACASDFTCRELRSVGIRVVAPHGSYYMMPDFEILRHSLTRRGIKTGSQMCQAMFEEASVVLMAGGPSFLRPETELTARLCFVNFDGTVALRASREVGLDNPLDDTFLEQYCTILYDGIKALCQWVQKQLD